MRSAGVQRGIGSDSCPYRIEKMLVPPMRTGNTSARELGTIGRNHGCQTA